MKKIISLLFCPVLCMQVFSQRFSMAVIPDTQNYSYYKCQKNAGYPIDQSEIWFNQMKYLISRSYKKGGDIRFAIHLGDLVESRSNKISEWDIADKAMSILENEIPYLVVPGNHDCDEWIKGDDNRNKIQGNSVFIKYFGPESKHFKNKNYYGGAYNGVNSWGTFEVEDKKFLIIGLEIEPCDDVLAWAQEVINNHKGYATILFTHEFLSLVYDSYNPGFATRYKAPLLRSEECVNCAEQIWNKLIKKNKQIFLVLCGHTFYKDDGEAARTDIDDDGYRVYQLLSDFQGRSQIFDEKKLVGKKQACGDGWLRLLEFDIDNMQLHIRTYSTEFYKYEDNRDSDFIIKFDWDWNERFSPGVN